MVTLARVVGCSAFGSSDGPVFTSACAAASGGGTFDSTTGVVAGDTAPSSSTPATASSASVAERARGVSSAGGPIETCKRGGSDKDVT